MDQASERAKIRGKGNLSYAPDPIVLTPDGQASVTRGQFVLSLRTSYFPPH